METPRIAVIETTIGSEQEMYDDMYLPDGEYASFSDTLRARGMEPVYIPLGIDNYRDVQNTKYFADLIRSCHIVFFTGGDQAYYGLALANPDGSPSLVAQAITDVLKTAERLGAAALAQPPCPALRSPTVQAVLINLYIGIKRKPLTSALLPPKP